MAELNKPYSVIKLHDRDERCWAIVDCFGAIVIDRGLKIRLTRAEARAYAQGSNDPPDSPATSLKRSS